MTSRNAVALASGTFLIGTFVGWWISPASQSAAPDQRRSSSSTLEVQPRERLDTGNLAADQSREPGHLHSMFAAAPGIQRHKRFNVFLDSFTKQNWPAMLDLVEQGRARNLFSNDEFRLSWERLGEVGGEDVVTAALHREWIPSASHAMRGWASNDPDAARDYFARNPNADADLTVAYLYAIASTQPDVALPEVLRLPAANQLVAMRDFAMEPSLAFLVTRWLDASSQLQVPKDFADSFNVSEVFRTMVLYNRGNRTPAEKLAWLQSFAGRPYASADAVTWLHEWLIESGESIEGTADWLTRFSARAPDTAFRTFHEFFSRTQKCQEAAHWLTDHQDHVAYDHATMGLLNNAIYGSELDPRKLEELISRMKDEVLRSKAATEHANRAKNAIDGISAPPN